MESKGYDASVKLFSSAITFVHECAGIDYIDLPTKIPQVTTLHKYWSKTLVPGVRYSKKVGFVLHLINIMAEYVM